MAKDYNDQTVRYYDQKFGEYIGFTNDIKLTEYIDTFLGMVPKRCKILDAGCAQGRDAAYMRDKGYLVSGVDGAQNMVAYAKKEHKDIDFKVSDVRSMPFEQNSFSGLLSSAVLLHFNDRDAHKVLKEFTRVLQPGGYLAVSYREGEGVSTLKYDEDTGDERYFQNRTRAEMTQMLEEHGYKVVAVRLVGEDEQERVDKPREITWAWIYAQLVAAR